MLELSLTKRQNFRQVQIDSICILLNKTRTLKVLHGNTKSSTGYILYTRGP